MKNSTKIFFTAFIAGIIFASGLIIASMNNPNYVQGFLNFGGIMDNAYFGAWYPKLAFVMFGATVIMFITFRLSRNKITTDQSPLFAEHFNLPEKTQIDKPLIIGASLFGIGWGLYGYCPGPAIASLFVANTNLLLFIVFMIIGMGIAKKMK